jgi:DNA-binding CsgD family transcriptional regulator
MFACSRLDLNPQLGEHANGPVLLGRSREIEAIDRLLLDARSGQGRSLLLSGEPGIGKTALLGVARERAGAALVIEDVGIEAEANLPFAALGTITRPLLPHLRALPERQASAVEVALAIGPGAPPPADRLAVCAGVLGLLRAAAADGPLLVLIDDAHWLDTPSAECLGYAARRLGGSRVALLAATRTGIPIPPLDGRLSDERHVTGLGNQDARALLAATAGELAPTTTTTLLDAAAGNPLALLELPSLLSDEQRAGIVPFEPAPAPGGALWDAFERQVAGLGAEAGQAMLVAAASLDRALGPVVAACRDLDIDLAALEHAEASGLLALGDDRLGFSHPLLRAVVYEGATGSDRRRAHAALAPNADADAAAWHLAAASLGPDAAVADSLEAAGHRAAARGAHSAAADAHERAARLSDDDGARSRRLFAAGLAAAMGGAYARGAALLEPVAEIDDPTMRAGIRHLLGMVTLTGGIRGAIENHDLLTEEAERTAQLDPAMAAALHADAGVTACVGGDCRRALAAAERAIEILPRDAPPAARCQAHSMLGMGLALAGRAAEARPALDEAGRLLAGVEPLSPAAQSIAFALHARVCTGQEPLLCEEVAGLADAARDAGTDGLLPYYQLVAADGAYRLGDWASAAAAADEAVAIADDTSQRGPLSIALVVRARVHAARGEETEARAAVERGIALAEPPGYGSTPIWGHAALGFLELGLGHTDAAIEQLEEAQRLAEAAGLEDPVIVPWACDLAEALVQAGEPVRAHEVSEQLATRAERSGAPLALALAARCRGLTANGEFEQPFTAALELHERCSSPFERARTLLSFGSRLHRARRRVEARERLREALATFDELGAAPWTRHARAELRAAGGIRRAAPSDPDELTAQELRVALAVGRGASNREVAAELFLSPKTIEFHLGRVYRKLGIHSRSELAVLVTAGSVGRSV